MALIHNSANRAIINAGVEGMSGIVGIAGKSPGIGEMLAKAKEALVKEFGDDAWLWYRTHENDVIFTLKEKVFFFNVSVAVKVKHARRIFEEIAGPEPIAS